MKSFHQNYMNNNKRIIKENPNKNHDSLYQTKTIKESQEQKFKKQDLTVIAKWGEEDNQVGHIYFSDRLDESDPLELPIMTLDVKEEQEEAPCKDHNFKIQIIVRHNLNNRIPLFIEFFGYIIQADSKKGYCETSITDCVDSSTYEVINFKLGDSKFIIPVIFNYINDTDVLKKEN